jgi:hypothetical protein
LLELRREVLDGKSVMIEEINDRCDDHVTKQKAGMLSLTIRADRGSGLGELLQSRFEAPPGSNEWKEADDTLAKIDRGKKKRSPASVMSSVCLRSTLTRYLLGGGTGQHWQYYSCLRGRS